MKSSFLSLRSLSSSSSSSSLVLSCGCATAGYLLLVQLLRYRLQRQNQRLFHNTIVAKGDNDNDNDNDSNSNAEVCRQIQSAIAFYEFPLVFRLSLEFALFRTYAIPSISSLLEKTKSFETNCGLRYDDTDLLIGEMTQNPFNSKRSITAIQRINAIHNIYKPFITNDDMLYVLSVFIVEPIRWVNKIEWRSFTPEECQAFFITWRDIGTRMGIQNIPTTLKDYILWNEHYEEQYMKFAPSNVVISNATMNFFLSLVPTCLHPFGKQAAYCLMDTRLRHAMGFPEPSPTLKRIMETIFTIRKLCLKYVCLPRLFPVRRTPAATTNNNNNKDNDDDDDTGTLTLLCPRFHVYERNYVHGYQTQNLGTAPPGKLMTERPQWKITS